MYIERNKIEKSNFSFLGEPKGDVNIICKILSDFFSTESTVELAYVSIIKFKNEEAPTLGIFICFSRENKKFKREVLEFCLEEIGNVNVFFLKELPLSIQSYIRNNYTPFYK